MSHNVFSFSLFVRVFLFQKLESLNLGIIKSGRLFHKNILNGIMKSPMEFFDTTPTGRIVNRFGKDMDAVDMTIPGSIRGWISCLLRIVSTMVILGKWFNFFFQKINGNFFLTFLKSFRIYNFLFCIF